MPLNRNCPAKGQDPPPPGSPEAAGAVTPLPPGLGAGARACPPHPASVCPPQVCGVGLRRLGGSVSLRPARRGTGRAALQAATFPRSPTWAREENPGGPPGVTGLGRAPPGRMGGCRGGGGSPRRRGGGFLLGGASKGRDEVGRRDPRRGKETPRWRPAAGSGRRDPLEVRARGDA